MPSYLREDDAAPPPVRIPSDVERPDAVLGPLSARQAVQVGSVLVVLWLAYPVARHHVPPLVCLAAALPVLTATLAAVLTRRDGLPLDRWVLAAWRHHRSPHRLVPGSAAPAPVAQLQLPLADIAPDGVLDLAGAGRAVLSRAGTVNFALRTGVEQQALIAAFAGWLNALTGPVQVLVRSQRLDLGPAVAALERAALPHPLLARACREHAAFLTELAAERDLLSRQVLVAHREPGTDRAAGLRALRRAEEAVSLLAAAEVPLHTLRGRQAFAQLAAATAPDSPVHPDPALPGEPVTCRGRGGGQ
ncbi:PrgI family protein [Kitasatospora viridis]|uniref:PrgI family protein n=1 Tax=Kitasatospora viridis TaxID=281105 RepID=A0A561TW50_9ACTN|nr:PrgI family protein [Kitasatospora viridis]TWF91338.1 PrgI family protein [Kitasatospora viridis]